MIDLSAIPFVDGHMHPPLAERPTTPDAYRWPWYEGNFEYRDNALELVSYRSALRELAFDLGCDHTEEGVVEAIGRFTPERWAAECCDLGLITGLVCDTGYPPAELAMPVDELASATNVAVARLTRIETVAEALLGECPDLASFDERVSAALCAALDGGASGLKSVIAYRSGLAVRPPDREGAAAALARLRGTIEPRIAEQALCDHLLGLGLAICRERSVPMQLHAGYGDRDTDMRLGDPFEFRYALESGACDGVPIVFLHAAYPFTRNGAILAAQHRDVYLDVATCIPPLGNAALVTAWREALAVAPITRIQASSDAAGVIEQAMIGAKRARRTLARALQECFDSDELSLREVERAAELILGGNARRLYL